MKFISLEEVQRRVGELRTMRDEAAHMAEDDLWETVLMNVAAGAPNSAALAAAALKTIELSPYHRL